jgi:hypothetical protein
MSMFQAGYDAGLALAASKDAIPDWKWRDSAWNAYFLAFLAGTGLNLKSEVYADMAYRARQKSPKQPPRKIGGRHIPQFRAPDWKWRNHAWNQYFCAAAQKCLTRIGSMEELLDEAVGCADQAWLRFHNAPPKPDQRRRESK